MALATDSRKGWKLNRINVGAPYHVKQVGRYGLHQVCDRMGTVALSGPHGAVFCTPILAKRLCVLANAGRLG